MYSVQCYLPTSAKRNIAKRNICPFAAAGTSTQKEMCIQVSERYSVCKCLYYKHAVDPCAARSQRGHTIQEKTVLVGYVCEQHRKSSGGSRMCLDYLV